MCQFTLEVTEQYCFTLFTYAGLSITIMKSDENILKRLDAPTKAPAWPVGSEGSYPHGIVDSCTGFHKLLDSKVLASQTFASALVSIP